MALHDKLSIHRTGSELLGLAVTIQSQMPRGLKRSMGDKIVHHCSEMLDLMAMANATRGEQRAAYIREILKHVRTATVWLRVAFDLRAVSVKPWSQSVEMLNSIGKQATGWMKNAREKAPAA